MICFRDAFRICFTQIRSKILFRRDTKSVIEKIDPQPFQFRPKRVVQHHPRMAFFPYISRKRLFEVTDAEMRAPLRIHQEIRLYIHIISHTPFSGPVFVMIGFGHNPSAHDHTSFPLTDTKHKETVPAVNLFVFPHAPVQHVVLRISGFFYGIFSKS